MAWIARPIAYLVGLSGLTYLVQGWMVGSADFSGTYTILILLAWALSLAWMTWPAVGRLADAGSGSPSPGR